MDLPFDEFRAKAWLADKGAKPLVPSGLVGDVPFSDPIITVLENRFTRGHRKSNPDWGNPCLALIEPTGTIRSYEDGEVRVFRESATHYFGIHPRSGLYFVRSSDSTVARPIAQDCLYAAPASLLDVLRP